MTDFLQVENEKIVRNSSGNEKQRNMLRGESSSPPPHSCATDRDHICISASRRYHSADLMFNLIPLQYPVVVITRKDKINRDQEFFLKFKSAHNEYRNQAS